MQTVFRVVFFLLGCIATRLLLTWIAFKYSDTRILQILGVAAIIPAIGFFVIYIGGYRKTGPEVFGNTIWWNNMRPVHGFLYALFAFMALYKPAKLQGHAWKVLLLDVMIGLMAFIFHHLGWTTTSTI